MDKNEAIQKLLEWYGNQPFTVKQIANNGHLEELVELIGASPTRSQFGRRLTDMGGYRCVSGEHVGATLNAVKIPMHEDPRPGIYQVVQQ